MDKNEVFEVIRNNIMDIMDLPAEEITQEKSLRDLGANSIDRVEIITLSMEDLGLKIALTDLGDLKNIGGLTEFFHERI